MPRPFSIYLRTYRKKFGLSEREAAELVGMETGQTVARHESKVRIPTLLTAFAYQVVFDVPIRALFPELYRQVEQGVLQRACALRDELLAQKLNRRSMHKLRCVNEVIKRIEAPDEV
jgi:transcriptional regulator with XRE-family HTH domain